MDKKLVRMTGNVVVGYFEYQDVPADWVPAGHLDVTDRTDNPQNGSTYDPQTDRYTPPPEESD